MEKDYHIYLGICLANNDPEMRGRIKIYIPQLAPTINGLEVGDNQNVDKFFNFIGTNNETSNEISNNLQALKDILPWAEYAGPICGGNASGRYNATLKTGTTSDSNAWQGDNLTDGFRPAQLYVGDQAHPDAFSETGIHNNKFVNQYAYQYTPSNYSGFARGLFSIPNVGAHIYVFFMDGDRNFPVYFASAYSQEDIKRIFTLNQDVSVDSNMDYPATYENVDKKNLKDANVRTYRSKTVLNSNKHTIEAIDTDLHEILKFTHYSGSFKEFNNYANIELATNNDQKLVIGDQFLTVQKNQSEYIKKHRELIVGGDHYINIGETDHNKVKEILNIHKKIHEYKMLFDVQRAQYGEMPPNNLSPKQIRSGKFTKCPICQGKPYDPYDENYGSDILNFWKEAPKYREDVCMAAAIPEELTGEEAKEQEQQFNTFLTGDCHSIYLEGVSEQEQQENEYCHPIEHPYKGQIGYYKGTRCACCNNENQATGQKATPGESPSTESGAWKPEQTKQAGKDLDQLILSLTPDLFKLEKELGAGGDEIKTVSMNKIETIGLTMNDMPSFRVDPIGKLKIDGCWVAPQGTYDNFRPSPHVEYVDVADIPGGDYILTCMNKYKLLVGSRGINIQTTGPIDIYGTIVNFTAEQLNISSKNEIVIDGGERLTLRAKKITALPVEHNAFVVEGLLHVTRNVIVEGGSMYEGEVAILHITAPIEWQETQSALWMPTPDEACTMLAIINGKQATISLPRHTHWFKNLPLTLLPHPEAVREAMMTKGINSRNRIAASSAASNPTGNCDSSLIDSVGEQFDNYAYEQANKDYQDQSGDPNPLPKEIDGAGTYTRKTYNCRTIGNAFSGDVTEVKISYYWTYKEKYNGNFIVVGTVSSGNQIIDLGIA
jgi:hypothetical protein